MLLPGGGEAERPFGAECEGVAANPKKVATTMLSADSTTILFMADPPERALGRCESHPGPAHGIRGPWTGETRKGGEPCCLKTAWIFPVEVSDFVQDGRSGAHRSARILKARAGVAGLGAFALGARCLPLALPRTSLSAADGSRMRSVIATPHLSESPAYRSFAHMAESFRRTCRLQAGG
jgi:hypothetical protein